MFNQSGRIRDQAGPLPPATIFDHGIFILYLAGRQIGREKFDIQPNSGGIEARAEIDLTVEQGGRNLNFKTFPDLVLNPQLQPLTYSWRQQGAQSSKLEVDFRLSPAVSNYHTVTGQDERRDFALPKDFLIVDDNVIHQYELVADRYRMTASGKQTFKAFIPQEALPGSLTVEETGAESVQLAGREETLHHLLVSSDLAQIDLWLDDHQRLQRVLIRAAQFEAIRKE